MLFQTVAYNVMQDGTTAQLKIPWWKTIQRIYRYKKNITALHCNLRFLWVLSIYTGVVLP